MSGFLQRLALRESGAAAVLAPRVTGWFESPAAPFAPPLPPATPERDVPIGAVAVATVAAAPSQPDGQAQVLAARLERVPIAAVSPAPVPPASAAPPSLDAPRSAVPSPRAAPPAPSPRETRRAAAAPVAPAPAAMARATAAPQPPAPPHAATATAPAESPAPSQMHAESAAAPRADPVSAHPHAPLAPALAAPGPRLPAAALRAVQAAAGRRVAPDAATQPVIQVTIGRLEVRAVQAAAAPAAPRPRQTPTSLDAYLAQRNGEGRR